MMRPWLVIAVAASAASAMGCAEITYGDPEVRDTVVRREAAAVLPGADVRGEVVQAADGVRVSAAQRCELVERRQVERVTTRDKRNEDIGPELALFGLGSIPASFGVLYLADASSVHDADRNARLYNPVGPEGAAAAGVVLLILGAAIMAVPAIDTVRSIGSDVQTTTVVENGDVLRPDVPCRGAPAPAAGRAVTGRLPGRVFSLGSTDGEGRLTIPVERLAPPDVFRAGDVPPSMEIWVGERALGRVDLAPVARAQAEAAKRREESAWRSANPEGCRDAAGEDACADVRAFLDAFPDGEHAAEAKALLERAEARERRGAQVAAPTDYARAAAQRASEAARAAALKAASATCRKECAASCKKDATCLEACVDEACR